MTVNTLDLLLPPVAVEGQWNRHGYISRHALFSFSSVVIGARSAYLGSPRPSSAQAGQPARREGRSPGWSSPVRPSYCHCRAPREPLP